MVHFLPLLLGLYVGRFALYFILYSVVSLPFCCPHHFCRFILTPFLSCIKLQIRGIRSKIGSNECLLCCIDFLFHIVETLVRFFNKYAYVQVSDFYLYSSSVDVDHCYFWSLHVPAVFCLSFAPLHWLLDVYRLVVQARLIQYKSCTAIYI